MGNKVSPAGINRVADMITKNVKRLEAIHDEICEHLNNVESSVQKLKAIDGQDASSPILNMFLEPTLTTAERENNIHYYSKEVWDIKVSGGDLASGYTSTSLCAEMNENFELLRKKKLELEIAAREFVQYLVEMGIALSDIDSFRKLMNEYNVNTYRDMNYTKIIDDGFIPQGFEVDEDGNIIVTAYDKKGEYRHTVRNAREGYRNVYSNRKRPSRLYLYDNKGRLQSIIELPNKAHVGGTAYDKKNKILYVTTTGQKVEAYDYKKIKKLSTRFYQRGKTLSIDNKVKSSCLIPTSPLKGKHGVATIACDNNKLYASSFDNKKGTELYQYDIKYQKDGVKLTNAQKYEVSNGAVQGIAPYTDKNGNAKLITCSSTYGTDTLLTKYDIKDGKLQNPSYKSINHSGGEGIYINNDKVHIIYEYGEQKTEAYDISKISDKSYSKATKILHEAGATIYDNVK